MRRTQSAFALGLLFALFAISTAHAQCVSLGTLGSPYSQNFDTLSNTAGSTTNNLTITGWFMTETGGGARDNEQYAVDTGGSGTGDTYSYGLAAATNRALGQLRSGTLIPNFGSCYTNNTGSTITSLDVNYFGEQWRIGNTAAARDDRMDFQYSLNATSLTTGTWIDVDPLDFTNPIKTAGAAGALDGNQAANRVNLVSTIGSLSIANGATFWIRWADLDATGADDGLAVDDFSITPQGAPPTPTLNIGDVTQLETNAGTTTFAFSVTLTAPAPAGGVTFDIATADGTAQDDNPVAEDNDYVPQSLTGQAIAAGSTGPYVFNVTVNGDLNIEPNETFFVNVTNITGATAGDTQGLGTITNDDSPPDLTINNVTLSEGNAGTTTFSFQVSLSAPAPPGGVTFDIATAADTATAGTDYTTKSLTAQTIPAGNSTYTFDVLVNGDAVFEGNETFFVNVTNVTGANVVDGQGLGTINNDDPAPQFTISDVVLTEGNAGTQTATFNVTLTGAREGNMAVNVATADSSATIGDADYVTNSTTLTFTPGDTTLPFAVTVNGDTNPEGDEQFFVNLSGATNGATISDNQGLGVIKNDEPRSINAVNTPFNENFDVLAQAIAATTPPAWTFVESGANANPTYNFGTGSSTTGDTYSFGVAGTNPITDRAFGGLQSGSLVPTIGAFFRNDTGVTITSLAIIYTGEEWRLGTASRTDRIDFQYSLDATSLTSGTWTDVDALDFTTPNTATIGAKDGNATANRQQRSAVINALSIPPGAVFWIRWNSSDASGADDGLAVDDFSIIANFAGAFLTIDDVSHFEGNAGTTTYTFTVSLSQPATGGGVTFDIATADNSATTGDNDYVALNLTGQNIPAGNSSAQFNVTVNGDVNVEPTETFFVNVTNVTGALVSDGQGVGQIIDDDTPITPIHNIQGNGASSPIVGSSVTIRGIVTGVKSNGFFVQEEDVDADADPNTSEGIFVFTSSTPPPAAAFTSQVQVSGTVSEFVPSSDPQQPPSTELTSPTVVQLLPPGQPLPTPVPLTPTFPDPAGPFDQLERVEHMRVAAASITVSGPSDGSIVESANTGTSNGRFHGVITGVARPFREPGIQAPDAPPAGTGTIPPIPRWDFNPERLRIESATINSQPILTVKSGDIVAPVVGPLDYGFRGYAIYPDGTLGTPVVTPGTLPTTVTTPLANELTVASFNMFHFYDTTDDGPTSDVVLTPAAFNARLQKASIAIRNNLKFPDVLGVQEVENLATLQALATQINNDAVANAQPNPQYFAYLQEGNDIGGIDVGFLVKTAPVTGGAPRVFVNSVVQIGKTTTWIDPSDNAAHTLNDRPSLVLDAVINYGSGASYPIIVINNHLRSLIGIESDAPDGLTTEGDRVRRKRQTQADFLANYIQGRLTALPGEHIVLVGDFNAFEFNDGFADTINTIMGTPPPDNETAVCQTCPTPPNTGDGIDQLNPNMTDLVTTPPAAERYSYVHDGNAQNIDHAIVSAGLITDTVSRRVEHPRIDADYPETERNNSATPFRISDHDPELAYLEIPPAGALEFSAANYNVGEATTTFDVTVIRTGGSFGAVSATYTIAAGTAQGADFTAGTGTVNFANGETSKTFPVTIVNDAIDEPDQTIALSLSNPMGGATLGAQSTATITIQDDDAPPVLTISDNSAIEGNAGSSNATLDVTLTGATEFTVTVNWATADDSATTAGNDYSAASGMLTFNGPGTQSVTVPILGDTTDEPNERLFVNLSGATNATVSDAQGDLTILDDDGAPQIVINDISTAEGNSGTHQVSLTVTLVGTSSQDVTFEWTLDPGTASCCGVDFSGPHGSSTFPVGGPTTRTISATIFGDTMWEPDETILVNLKNAVNATIADNQGVITILNDDPVPFITINDISTLEGNSGTHQVSLTVTLNGTSSQEVTFEWTLDPGTASCCGVDFSGPHGSTSFPVGGPTTRTISATIFGDTTAEPNETILVNLKNAVNATIADNQGVITILNDDGVFSATKAASGSFVSGTNVNYTVVLTNNSGATLADNVGNEFDDVLPAGLTLVNATATSGTAFANVGTNTVTWNGSLANGASVTITITATLTATSGTISNQGVAHIDLDNNGSNETSVVTDDPGTGGAGDPTVFAVAASATIPAFSPLMLLVLAMFLAVVALTRMTREEWSAGVSPAGADAGAAETRNSSLG